MSLTRTSRPRPAAAQSLADCLREFLTPALWKQAQQARPRPHAASRWTTQALVLTAVLMTWGYGDSQAERFALARVFYVASHGHRRRPGRTVQGFHQALARLPMAVLRTVAAGVRHRLAARLERGHAGFVVLGCDGTRVECPRSAELDARLGQAGKAHAAPTVWVTALVHLRSGLLWAWQIGKGTASERDHLRQLLSRLAPLTTPVLLVCDAGYHGFELAMAIVAQQASFLIRMSSRVTLYPVTGDGGARVRDRVRDRRVYYWPRAAQRAAGQAPLRARLIRVRGTSGRDVWLLTNVLDRRRLSAAQAGRYYRWRWENEGLFRTYKRTLLKVKLRCRTVRLVHREAESSLLATQLLLALGAGRRAAGERRSPRQLLLIVRAELLGQPGPGAAGCRRRLTAARRERRPRTSPKVARSWPRRVEHTPPKPPKLLTLTSRQKALISRLESQAA